MATWDGKGRQGEKGEEEEMRPGRLEAKATGVDDFDASDALWLPVELEGVEVVDQDAADPRLEGRRPRRRQGWPA